jgi:type II secretory pathway component PulJ
MQVFLFLWVQALAEAQQASQTATGRVTTLQERVQQLERFLTVSQPVSESAWQPAKERALRTGCTEGTLQVRKAGSVKGAT